YALVPGYILKWKTGSAASGGLAASHVEPVSSESERREIARIIYEAEGIRNIDFW
ncbi:MAG: hypothetical protein IBX68_08890, partial [Dehalococcoidia bacterium]|nr:hypothetical protein [Dehalococcoidia bacterium]